MLTIKDFNRITFLHHRGIVPPSPAKEGETAVEKRFVCTANMKLLEYGYVMAYDLFEACCAYWVPRSLVRVVRVYHGRQQSRLKDLAHLAGFPERCDERKPCGVVYR